MPKTMDYDFHECICECDNCSIEHVVDSTDFADVNDEIKSYGWINRKVDGELLTFCSVECFNEYKES